MNPWIVPHPECTKIPRGVSNIAVEYLRKVVEYGLFDGVMEDFSNWAVTRRFPVYSTVYREHLYEIVSRVVGAGDRNFACWQLFWIVGVAVAVVSLVVALFVWCYRCDDSVDEVAEDVVGFGWCVVSFTAAGAVWGLWDAEWGFLVGHLRVYGWVRRVGGGCFG